MPDLDTRIAEIAGRANTASKGPWEALDAADDEGANVVPWVGYTRSDGQIELIADCEQECGRADARFIANARSDIPFLLAALQQTREALREIVAGRGGSSQHVETLREIARAALAPEQTEGAA